MTVYDLDTRSAAELLQFSEYYIRELARDNKIPAVKFGREYRFNREELLASIMRPAGTVRNRPKPKKPAPVTSQSPSTENTISERHSERVVPTATPVTPVGSAPSSVDWMFDELDDDDINFD